MLQFKKQRKIYIKKITFGGHSFKSMFFYIIKYNINLHESVKKVFFKFEVNKSNYKGIKVYFFLKIKCNVNFKNNVGGFNITLKIWEDRIVKNDGCKEPKKAFIYFQEYLNLGAGRKLSKVAENTGKSDRYIKTLLYLGLDRKGKMLMTLH